MLDSAPVQMAS